MSNSVRVFLGLGALGYPFTMLFTWFVRGEPDGLLGSFAGLALLGVWLCLSIALLLAGMHNGVPWWSYLMGVVVSCLYFGGVNQVVELLRREPVQWMVGVPAIGPMLLCAYVVWAAMPRVRGPVSPALAAMLIWGLVLILGFVPSHRYEQWQQRRAAEAAKSQAVAAAHRAQLKQLPEDAPVQEILPFFDYGETYWVAKAKLDACPRKQADFEAMMASGDYRAVHWLAEYKAEPTAGLCQGMREFLKTRTAMAEADVEKKGFAAVAEITPGITSTVDYFAERGCPMLPELSEWVAALEAHPDPAGKYLRPALQESMKKLETQ